MHASKNDIQKQVFSLIADQMGIKAGDISLTDDVRRLGADSLDVVELIMVLEEEFDVDISDEQAERFDTVQSICDFLTPESISAAAREKIPGEFRSGLYLHEGGVKGMRSLIAEVDGLSSGEFFKHGGLIVASLKTGHLWIEMLHDLEISYEISTASIVSDLSSLTTQRSNMVHIFLYDEPKKPKKKNTDNGPFRWMDSLTFFLGDKLDGENQPGILLFDCISHIADTYVDNLIAASKKIKLLYAVSESPFQIKATSSVRLGLDTSCDYEDLRKILPVFDYR